MSFVKASQGTTGGMRWIIPLVSSALNGLELPGSGNSFILAKGLPNPDSKVYYCLNSRSEAAKQILYPGKMYRLPFNKMYIWTDAGTSLSGKTIEIETGVDLVSSPLGTVQSPLFMQQRRANIAAQATPSIAAGGSATVSLDDIAADYYLLHFVVVSGRVSFSAFGPALSSHPPLEADATKMHKLEVVGNTFGWYAHVDSVVGYQVIGRTL